MNLCSCVRDVFIRLVFSGTCGLLPERSPRVTLSSSGLSVPFLFLSVKSSSEFGFSFDITSPRPHPSCCADTGRRATPPDYTRQGTQLKIWRVPTFRTSRCAIRLKNWVSKWKGLYPPSPSNTRALDARPSAPDPDSLSCRHRIHHLLVEHQARKSGHRSW